MKLYFQSIVQYRIDTDSGAVEIMKKFTSPIKGAKNFNKRKTTPKSLYTNEIQEEFV